MKNQRRYARTNNVKQNIEKVLQLKKLGLKNTEIAERFGVSNCFVGEILKYAETRFRGSEPA